MLLDRYDSRTEIAGSLITIANFLALIALNIYGLGVILSSIVGLSFTASAILGMGVVILYTILGGFRGIVMNDVLQTIAMNVGIYVMVPIAAAAVSAAGGFEAKLPSEHLDPASYGIDKIIGTYVVVLPVLFSSQDIWQRVFAARDLKTARRSVIASGIMLSMIATASVFLGLCARVILPSIEASQVLPELAKQLLGPGLTGVVVVAYIAAFAGSAGGFLLVISSAVTKDFYLNFMKRKLTDRQIVVASRWITLFCGLVPLGIIVLFPNVVAILFTVLTWFMILVPATLGGFFWPGATKEGAFWSIIVGWLVAVAYTAATGDAETAGVAAAVPTLIVFWLVSLRTHPRVV
jgi:SSS family solute:Na+ symporter